MMILLHIITMMDVVILMVEIVVHTEIVIMNVMEDRTLMNVKNVLK